MCVIDSLELLDLTPSFLWFLTKSVDGAQISLFVYLDLLAPFTPPRLTPRLGSSGGDFDAFPPTDRRSSGFQVFCPCQKKMKGCQLSMPLSHCHPHPARPPWTTGAHSCACVRKFVLAPPCVHWSPEWSKEKEGKCSSRHELPARCRARSRSPSVRCSARSRSPLVRSLVRHLLHEERRSKTQGGESGNLRARPGGHLAGTRKGRNKCERARPDHLARPPPNNNAHTLTAHADEAFAQHPIIMMGHSLARQPRPNPPENRAAHAPERGTPSVAGGHRTGCIAHSGSLDKVPFLLPPGFHL